MCQLCLDAARRHYPQLTEREIGELLFSATCYPLGSPEDVERQLIEVRAATDGSLGQAVAYADEMTTKAMEAADEDSD